ncbi:MAG: flagellar protein FlaG [Deltaproteobacteria bacterium]|nr:flagellar protein FlaG [Deltaproteobacteria bacterium]MBW1929092.1 flagellar protein FlaG [Deltaproteobacteria bacterium]MBW2023295.1 flagellar protein FlaG [Deltaproteobacteria bacterium]
MGLSGVITTQKISGADKGPTIEPAFQAQIRREGEARSKPESPKRPEKSAKDVQVATKDKLERVAKAMADYIESIQRDLHIKIDDRTDQVVIQVISKSDGKVIRQVPPQELLKLAAKMEEMVGVFFDKNA